MITRIKSTSMFVQQEIAGEASAHPAPGRRRGAFAGKARLLWPFSIDDAARTSSPDWARGTHAVTAPGDAVLVRGVYRREWAWRALSEAGSLSYARRGAATSIRAFHQGRARLGSGESPDAAPGWAPRMLGRLAAARAASTTSGGTQTGGTRSRPWAGTTSTCSSLARRERRGARPGRISSPTSCGGTGGR